MAEIIKMPKLSDTMEEGVVAQWHKKIGDNVDDGELLADIETDKATMEFESFQSGVLLHQGVNEGETAKVDSILAILGKKGEDISSILNGKKIAPNDAINDAKSEIKKDRIKKSDSVDLSNINARIIKMPKLSDTMTEGTVASWQKQVGDQVESGEILAEIETDKATMEFESFEDGELLYQGMKEGESAEVDSILAIIGESGSDFQTLIDNYSNDVLADEELSEKEIAPQENKALSNNVDQKSSNNTTGSNGRIKISPLAKRLAKEQSIPLSDIVGSGEGGRIVKRDVESYKPSSVSSSPVLSSKLEAKEVAISQMRKTIAKRLSESKFSAPHFYLTIDIDMDEAITSRAAINSIPDVKVSFNDLVIKAAAAALKKHPGVNSSWLGDTIKTYEEVNVGVAVAVDEGLLVPVVRNADNKQLTTISSEVKNFAQLARDKKLQPQDWEGSTFSISNLGMFGIEEFTAIINPPNACIMAVGAIRQEPVVKDGQIVIGNRMKVTLSCDHRVVDGAVGSQFLQTFKTFLENPVTILA